MLSEHSRPGPDGEGRPAYLLARHLMLLRAERDLGPQPETGGLTGVARCPIGTRHTLNSVTFVLVLY